MASAQAEAALTRGDKCRARGPLAQAGCAARGETHSSRPSLPGLATGLGQPGRASWAGYYGFLHGWVQAGSASQLRARNVSPRVGTVSVVT